MIPSVRYPLDRGNEDLDHGCPRTTFLCKILQHRILCLTKRSGIPLQFTDQAIFPGGFMELGFHVPIFDIDGGVTAIAGELARVGTAAEESGSW